MRFLSFLLLLINPPFLFAEEGKLERAKKEVRAEKTAPSVTHSQTTSSTHSHYKSDSSAESNFFTDLIFDSIGELFASRFRWTATQPYSVVGNAPYPYYETYYGYYAPFGAHHENHIIGGALYAEASWIENNLQRYALGGHVSISSFTIRTDWQRYFEQRTNSSYDTLNVGTIDAEIAAVTNQYIRVNIGVGAVLFHDNIGTDAGPAFMVNTNIFPYDPFIIEGAYSYGDINDLDITSARVSLGAIWQRYDGYIGWQYTRIGSVTLDGPLLGMRLWF